MATFKVGQRVRVIKPENAYWNHLLGSEGTVLGPGQVKLGRAYEYGVRVDCGVETGDFNFFSWELAPLTDPDSAADQWAASKLDQLKKLVREPMPLDKQQLEEIHGGQVK
jgi:hypothetical protein